MQKRSAKTSSRTRKHRSPTLSPLPARTSPHWRCAWDLRDRGAGVEGILIELFTCFDGGGARANPKQQK